MHRPGLDRAIDNARRQAERHGSAWWPEFPRMLGAPAPLAGEAFSSWCWRAARRFQVSVRAFLRLWGLGEASFWVDSGHRALDAGALAASLGWPPESLAQFAWPQASVLADPEFACLTTGPLFRRPIHRYCGACLGGGGVLYFRQGWRMAHAFLCPVHRALLRDRCPRCLARIDLGRWPVGVGRGGTVERGLRVCPRCRVDLCSAAPATVPPELETLLLARQRQFDGWIRETVEEPDTTPFDQGLGLERSAGGLVDPNESRHRAVLTLALHRLCDGWGQAGGARARLRGHLRPVTGGAAGDPAAPRLLAGLDGPRLFGDAAAALGLRLRVAGTPAGGAFWTPTEESWTDDRAAGFGRGRSGGRWTGSGRAGTAKGAPHRWRRQGRFSPLSRKTPKLGGGLSENAQLGLHNRKDQLCGRVGK